MLRRRIGWAATVLLLLTVLAAENDPVAAAAPVGRFGWPLRPRPAVVRPFDNPAHDWLPGHRGVDLAGTPGQPVLAAGDGIVVFVGSVGGKSVVSLDHPGSLRTTYEPVRATVPVGARVTRGSVLGTLEPGHADCPAAACLHWGLRDQSGGRRGRAYLDPLRLLHSNPLRLKPVDPAA
ncbi:M23 family metallopeptidase [Nocardia arthritidis]|uniref:Peptidoglycan DD-metalloendopeptidase family protein n=1 Tax=Nocardia arthritidis TaxID=228602 RepID=A0A6G9YMQ4_9NOCA|nr:M23 family metallopeptidase [Nocardia arthritidis]QIS14569.1 peptidoglycan DD-metalloendopeptidase family protein [Nocardia arthritidis]